MNTKINKISSYKLFIKENIILDKFDLTYKSKEK